MSGVSGRSHQIEIYGIDDRPSDDLPRFSAQGAMI